jgi:alkylation response protein AidB-like acyl-CoA dehydrogenase
MGWEDGTQMTSIDALLAEGRAFLDATVPRRTERDEGFVWGAGSDRINVLEEIEREHLHEVVAAAKVYAAARFDAGLGWIDGPVEYGGRALSVEHAIAFHELEARYELPNLSPLTIAIGFIGPALLATGSEELKARYLPQMYRGDIIMCQLFSEPNAGSDLAGVSTFAARDGDEWVVNGQKVWTSSAHAADLGLCVTRTDRDVPKHKGLTTFLVDMHAPGVEIRPLRQMTGESNFNEVFLTEVRVPDSHRVGDVNAGFGVILTTLSNERSIATRRSNTSRGVGPFERIAGVVRGFGDRSDRHTRERLAQVYVLDRIKEVQHERWRQALGPGQQPGPETMLGKLHNQAFNRQLVPLLTEVLGARLEADTGEWGAYAWTEYVLATPGMRIGGGTEEIVKNTIAERVLGLPKEPKV